MQPQSQQINHLFPMDCRLVKLLAEIDYVCKDIDKKGGKKCQAEIKKLKELCPSICGFDARPLAKGGDEHTRSSSCQFHSRGGWCMHAYDLEEGGNLGTSHVLSIFWLCRNGPRRSSSTSSLAASARHFICCTQIMICPIAKRASAWWEMPRCWSSSLVWVRRNAARSLSASCAFSRRRWQSRVSGDYWKVFQ